MRTMRMIECLLIMSLTFWFTACHLTPAAGSESEDLLSQSTSHDSEQSREAISSVIDQNMYRLFLKDGITMLMPDSPKEYESIKEKNGTLFYQLDPDSNEWAAVTASVMKFDSISGHSYNETTDRTIDIYQVKIGDWSGYCKRRKNYSQTNLLRRILYNEDGYNAGFEQRTKDYTLLQIFDDLYTIDDDHVLKRVTSRNISGYDYDTIEKNNVGDLFQWSWVIQPVTSLQDNRVFYLTSREGSFYNIWYLDLDTETEGKYCTDIALDLVGAGSGRFIAYLDQDVSPVFGKLLSSTDTQDTTEISEKHWKANDGLIYFADDSSTQILHQNQLYLLNAGEDHSVHAFGNTGVILENIYTSGSKTDLIYLDLSQARFSTLNVPVSDSLTSWQIIINKLLNETEDIPGSDIVPLM